MGRVESMVKRFGVDDCIEGGQLLRRRGAFDQGSLRRRGCCLVSARDERDEHSLTPC